MMIKDFQKDFSKCAYNFKRIRLYGNGNVIIFADDYEISDDQVVLIYGYHKVAYISADSIKAVCDMESD